MFPSSRAAPTPEPRSTRSRLCLWLERRRDAIHLFAGVSIPNRIFMYKVCIMIRTTPAYPVSCALRARAHAMLTGER